MHHPMRFSSKSTKSGIFKVKMVRYLLMAPLEKRGGNLKQGRTLVWDIEVMAHSTYSFI